MRLDDDPITEGAGAHAYILTIDESSGEVLALYRNWKANDEKLEKLEWYVEFKFIPLAWCLCYWSSPPHWWS